MSPAPQPRPALHVVTDDHALSAADESMLARTVSADSRESNATLDTVEARLAALEARDG